MEWLASGDYDIARSVLQRGVASVYLVALWSTFNQFPALVGERGLLPVPQFLTRTNARRLPSLFRLHYSDRLLRVVVGSGMAVAALLVAGIPQLGPPWLPAAAFLALWFGYLSIVHVGQVFYGFGWEMLLVEAGFTVAFLGSDETGTPLPTVLLLRWLVFRLEFGAGMIKMRGGRSWRDLTALYYHHETQPMPNPLSRRAHLLPKRVHRIEVLGNHASQLIVPFLLFAPQPVARIAAGLIILTQLWLLATGNFAWLNALTIVLAFAAVDDASVALLLPVVVNRSDATLSMPATFGVVLLAVTALLIVLSWWPAKNLVSRRQLTNASFNRFQLANAYGAFGSVTEQRDEVIVEGTEADHPCEGDWHEYPFRGKPGDVSRGPGQFAPYHLRLDWQMWFLALGSPDRRWFDRFLWHLLEADRPTLRLLARDPFDGRRPRFVRATVYRYRFSTPDERRATGDVWSRRRIGTLVPPVRLPPKAPPPLP